MAILIELYFYNTDHRKVTNWVSWKPLP